MPKLIVPMFRRVPTVRRILFVSAIMLLFACPVVYTTVNYNLGLMQMANRLGISSNIMSFEEYMQREFVSGMPQQEVHTKLERLGVSFLGGSERWAPGIVCEAAIFRFNVLPTFGILVFDNQYRYRFCYNIEESGAERFAYFFRTVS